MTKEHVILGPRSKLVRFGMYQVVSNWKRHDLMTMMLLERSPTFMVLFSLWMIHYNCHQDVSALIAPKYNTKVTVHNKPFHLSSRQTRPSKLASSPKDDDDTNANDDDDGWGSNLPVETRQQEKKQAATRVEPERDLFIPIFAIISIAGLFGSYGYEMLRLQANGELYLPWTQHY